MDTLPRDTNMNNGTRTQRDMASLPVPLTNQTEPWTLINDTVTPNPIHSVSLLYVWIVFLIFGKTIFLTITVYFLVGRSLVLKYFL